MARVTHVKRAQQRYETKPVLDADGKPVKVALTKADGSPKMTKAKGGRPARPVFITKTVADKTKPLPNRKCGKCGVEIKVGDPYKWIKPKSGPYGGRLMVRCGACPTWQVWDYSSSLSAQTAQISHDFGRSLEGCESVDDVTAALEEAAEAVRGIAEQKRESAENIRDGFGHDTYQSEELDQVADDLEGWADEIESADVPDLDDDEYAMDCQVCDGGQVDCDDCDGTGEQEHADDEESTETCPECQGRGQVECADCEGTGTDPDKRDLDAWREAVQDAVSIVDECPV